MELRHFRVFIAVAQELHFGRAARCLNLSQPPVSAAIAELEQELEVVLFERTTRSIALTPAGEQLLLEAKAVLAAVDDVKKKARRISSGSSGTLSIGFMSLAAYSYLPSTLKKFMNDHPDVRVVLSESTTDKIVPDLLSDALDVGCIFSSPLLPKELRYQATNRDLLIVALQRSHPLAKLNEIPLEKLANDQFLTFERFYGPIMFDTLVSTCMRHGFSPKIFPARQMHTIVSLVSEGLGVAVVPACVEAMRRKGVVYRPIKGDKTTVENGVSWRAEEKTALVQEFLKYVPKIK